MTRGKSAGASLLPGLHPRHRRRGARRSSAEDAFLPAIRFSNTAQIALSATVPRPGDTFGYAYIPYIADWDSFDRQLQGDHRGNRQGRRLSAPTPASASIWPICPACRGSISPRSTTRFPDRMTASRAFPGASSFEASDGRWSCPVAVQVHHALVDGSAGRPVLRGRAGLPRPACGLESDTPDPVTPNSSGLQGPAACALAYFVNKRLTRLAPSTKTMLWAKTGAGHPRLLRTHMNGSVSA
jgi:hypothetical protein